MYRNIAAALLISSFGLCACNRLPGGNADQGDHKGRYSGVGIYSPSKQWTKVVDSQQSIDPQIALPIDDQVIIVVQDSATGEVRACGDLTGYCIGMNPWKTALASAQIAPLKLTEHRTPDTPDATAGLTAKRAKSDKPDGEGSENGHSR